MNQQKLDELQKYADELQQQIAALRAESRGPTVPWEGATVRYVYVPPAPGAPGAAPRPGTPDTYEGPIPGYRAEIVDSELHPQFMPNDTGENPWPDGLTVLVIRKDGTVAKGASGVFSWKTGRDRSFIGSRPVGGWEEYLKENGNG